MERLGDKVKQLTSAVGIEQCEGCKRRAEKLNEWSRRGILKSGAFAIAGVGLSARNSTLKWLWAQASASPVPLSIDAAIGFVRTVITTEGVLNNLNMFYAPMGDVFLDSMHGIVTHINTGQPGTPLYEWLSQIKLTEAVDIFPGWKLDFVPLPSATNATGYRLILASASDVLVSDEKGVIYRAARPSFLPSAASLSAARDFPGAVVYTTYPNPSLARRLLRYFEPTPVYAQSPICCANSASCINCYGCCDCVVCCNCGSHHCTSDASQIDCWKCFFTNGCSLNPFTVMGSCAVFRNCSGADCCYLCAQKYWATYCLCNCCPK
jgi:hypothetical protein